MKLTPMEKTPVSPSSPIPLPLILLTPDSTNPHLLNKTRTIKRVDSYDLLHRVRDIFPPILHEENPFFPHEKDDTKVQNEEKVEIENETEEKGEIENTINFKSVYESSWSLLCSGCEIVSRKIREFSGVNENMVKSMAGIALFFGAFMYVRKRDKRERELLTLLLEEKDLRIAQMLQQIELINDIRSLSSQVPALRKN